MKWSIILLLLVPVCAYADEFEQNGIGSQSRDVVEAWKHNQKLDDVTACHTRYLSIYNIKPADRAIYIKAANYHINALSTEVYIVKLEQVSADLFAVDIRNYGWLASTYDHLANVEPYYTVRITNGNVTKPAAAPWLPPIETVALYGKMKSTAPIVRLDFFIHETLIQEDREGHGYYDFLRLGRKVADFYSLVGADEKLSDLKKKDMFAAIAKSQVARNNRAIKIDQGLNGGVYGTIDFKKSKDRQNTVDKLYLSNHPIKGDAREFYGPLPNGLPAKYLAGSDDARQNFAPPEIAGDSESKTADKRVHIGLSCDRCHVEVLRPINDVIRLVYVDDARLDVADFQLFKDIERRYLTDLPTRVATDRANYAKAIYECNLLTPQENSRVISRAFEMYEEELTVDDVARELGVTKNRLIAAIRAIPGKKPTTFTGLTKLKPVPIIREHFEEYVPVLYKYLENKQ